MRLATSALRTFIVDVVRGKSLSGHTDQLLIS